MTTNAIDKSTVPAGGGDTFALTPEIRQAWTEATTAAGALAAAASVERTAKTSLVYTLAAAAIVATKKDAAEPCKVSAITGALALEYPDAPAITGLEMVHRAAQRITNGAIVAKVSAGDYAATRAFLVAQLTHTDEDGKQHLANLKDLTAISADDVAMHMPLALTATPADHPDAEGIQAAQAQRVAFLASGGKKANGSTRKRGAAQETAAEKETPKSTAPSAPSKATADREAEQRARVIASTVVGISEAMQRLDAKGMQTLVERLAGPHGLSKVSWTALAEAVETMAAERAAKEETAKEETPAPVEPSAADAVDAARKKAATQAKRAATIAAKKAAKESAA